MEKKSNKPKKMHYHNKYGTSKKVSQLSFGRFFLFSLFSLHCIHFFLLFFDSIEIEIPGRRINQKKKHSYCVQSMVIKFEFYVPIPTITSECI